MKIAYLLLITLVGIWYNWNATRHWWAIQKNHLPTSSDIAGWVGVAFSAIWHVFVFVFFAGLTLNNTVFR